MTKFIPKRRLSRYNDSKTMRESEKKKRTNNTMMKQFDKIRQRFSFRILKENERKNEEFFFYFIIFFMWFCLFNLDKLIKRKRENKK